MFKRAFLGIVFRVVFLGSVFRIVFLIDFFVGDILLFLKILPLLLPKNSTSSPLKSKRNPEIPSFVYSLREDVINNEIKMYWRFELIERHNPVFINDQS